MYQIHKAEMKVLADIARWILGGDSSKRDFVVQRLSENMSRSTGWRRIKDLNELIASGYLEISGETINLTTKGLDAVKNGTTLSPILAKSKKWDRTWHIIAYDIPEKYKKERNFFQKKIKEAGLYQLQGSMWVYPYECEEELGLMANELGLTNYVAFMKTNQVPYNNEVKQKFNIK